MLLLPWVNLWTSGLMVSVAFIVFALLSVFPAEETYGKELDYIREIN
jgi:hypothetical protein